VDGHPRSEPIAETRGNTSGHDHADCKSVDVSLGVENDDAEFVESKWVEQGLRIRDDVMLQITDHCPRFVMITLPQGNLPKGSGIPPTAARHNEVHGGVYA
jgi:uncharacterized protein